MGIFLEIKQEQNNLPQVHLFEFTTPYHDRFTKRSQVS